MDRSVSSRRINPDLKASLAELYAGLQSAAVEGVVPLHIFRSSTEALGLSQAERIRLTEELARLELLIGEPAPATETDSGVRAEVVLSRVDIARQLLERFADKEGKVASRAMEGVVRLAGLSDLEAGQLSLGIPELLSADEPSGEATGEAECGPGGGAEDQRHGAAVTSGDVVDAVAVARALLVEHRFIRNPKKRILTAAEEVGLSLLLRGGAERAGEEPTDEELSELTPTDVRRRARDCLIMHNEGLVHSLARQFPGQGLEYEDLFQHGVLGLMRAARKFDPLMGNKFSTYATWWIRQSITRALADEGSLIRIPVHMHELVQKVARTERALLAQGRSLRAAEVAVACDLSVAKVEKIRQISRRTDSLDRIIGDGARLGDLIEARTAVPGVEHTVLAALDETRVMDVVQLLPERYAHIVIRRFGLDDTDPATLEEIGKDLKVTRERIRQLEAKVLPLLRLAYTDGDPYTAMRLMLTDGWHGPTAANAVSAIAKDLTGKEWRTGVEALCEFRKRNRSSLPGPDHEEGTFPLGRWLVEQRQAGGIAGYSLPNHRRIVLESLGMMWKRRPDVAQLPRNRRRMRRAGLTSQMRPHSGPSRSPSPAPVGAAESPVLSRPEPAQTAPASGLGVTESTTGPTAVEAAADPVRDEHARASAADSFSTPGRSPATVPGRQDAHTETAALPRNVHVDAAAAEPAREAGRNAEALVNSPYTAHWEKATRLAAPFDGNLRWTAGYALLALGPRMLIAVLGAREAAAVTQAARSRRLLDRPVLLALESLTVVLDALRDAGLRPEEFFEPASPALLGNSPRAYLTEYPLVKPEARLALSDALRVFVDDAERSRVPVPAGVPAAAPDVPVPSEVAATMNTQDGPTSRATRISPLQGGAAELRQARSAAQPRSQLPPASRPDFESDLRLW